MAASVSDDLQQMRASIGDPRYTQRRCRRITVELE
jgi:hypothetical protein